MDRQTLTRRDFLKMSMTTAVGLGLAACAPQATPAPTEEAQEAPVETVEVVFWSELVGSKEEGRATLISAFNAASDRIVVRHEGFPDKANDKFLAAVAGGIVPDIFGAGAKYMPGYVGIDALADLAPYLEASDAVSPEDFPEGVLALGRHGGKIWGLPVFADTMVLYYNKDLLAEAGFDAESPPRDWDTLREAAIAMTKRDANGELEVAGCLLGSWSVTRLFIPMIYAWGGQLLNDDNSKAAFNGPEGKEFLQMVVDLILKDRVTESGWGEEFEDSVNEPFIAGKGAMVFDVPATTKRILRWRPGFTNWGITGLPAGPQGFAQEANTILLMIPAAAKHKEEAWRVMEYWMDPKVMVRFAQDIYRPPSTIAALEDETLMSDPTIAPISEALKHTIVLPETAHYAEIWDALNAEIGLALLGEKSAAQALDDAAGTVDRVLALD